MKLLSSAFLFFILSLMPSSCQFAGEAIDAKKRITAVSAETSGKPLSDADKRGFYQWLVKEMYEQIYLRPISNKKDIVGWANVFSQGGSIEGVYHGLILSTDYSAMERGRATLKVVRFFGEEMAFLDLFDSKDKDKEEKQKKASEKYVKEHMQDSAFTLKRLLGEKVLSQIEKKNKDREALAAWYGKIASRWNKLEVPFGMKQRNITDEEFHTDWAKQNSLGLIQWELLNRVHRLINHFSGFLVNQPGK